jgi:hypothetical protein
MIDYNKYRVDFAGLINRDQQGNASDWSLDQLRDKSVYDQVLQAFVNEANEFYRAICELGNARTIIGGTGVWLDGLGRIVGQPRENTPVDLPDTFFYWDGYATSVAFTNPADGNSITIEGVTYTFKNTLAVAGHVKRESAVDDTIAHLVKAINGTGTAGTDYYTGTTACPTTKCVYNTTSNRLVLIATQNIDISETGSSATLDTNTSNDGTNFNYAPRFMDSANQWVTGGDVNAGSAPTDGDFRDQIVRRVYQNHNKFSSIPELQAAIQDVLGIHVMIEQTGCRKIKLLVPAGTPSWVKYYLTGKTFAYDSAGHTFNRWWFPFPAGVQIDATIGEY